jgi:hypothetical protein
LFTSVIISPFFNDRVAAPFNSPRVTKALILVEGLITPFTAIAIEAPTPAVIKTE